MSNEIVECLKAAALVSFEDWKGREVPAEQARQIKWLWAVVIERLGELRVHLDGLELSLTSGVMAERIGLDGSGALNKELERRGLPPYDELRDFYYVVACATRFTHEESLSKFASQRGARSSDYYRMVERTGCTWTTVKENGAVWAKANALTHWAQWIRARRH